MNQITLQMRRRLKKMIIPRSLPCLLWYMLFRPKENNLDQMIQYATHWKSIAK